MIEKQPTKRFALIGVITVFWLILGALFGPQNVRNGLRASLLVVLVLGIVFTVRQKIVVVFQTNHPPNQPRTAYNAIIARTTDGNMTGSYVVGLVCEGTRGFVPQPGFGTFVDYAEAKRKANELNSQIGLTNTEANRLINRWA